MVDLLAGPWGPLLIFAFRIVDVSLGTLRMLLAVRGRRYLPPLIGFVEVLVWVLAAGAVVQNLTSPLHVVAYAGGFAAGTAVGLWAENRLALGLATVQAITTVEAPDPASALRELGFGVTRLQGHGRDSEVNITYTVVRRRYVPDVVRTIESVAPGAFVSVQDERIVRRGWLAAVRRK
ncbi:MAG: DUF2179 domain-containing protein [Gemmatimonadota bacterium]|nr:DUF2179 domain-containing protein [Gemmatimonadota bacterium]